MKLKKAILAVAIGSLASCLSSSDNDVELLRDCWNAQPRGKAGEFLVSFDAIMLQGTEGGIFARTNKCLDYKLGIDYGADAVRLRFEAISNAASVDQFGVGVHGKGIVRLGKRESEYFIRVSIISLEYLHPMDDVEMEKFIRDFNIR